jgi:zinc transport system substrate-binding protein
LAGAALIQLGLTGCAATAPRKGQTVSIQVITGLYPIAQAVEQIGGEAVSVTDPVPPGADPRTYHLTAAQAAEVRRAAIVIVAGPGFQPSLDAAAPQASRVLDLQEALATSDPYVWLDPELMVRAVAAMATRLEAANPNGAAAYRAGARAFSDEVASTGIDYESTLSVCPLHTIVTADGAFLGLARTYGLTDQVVPVPAQATSAPMAAAVAQAHAAGATTAFSEPFVAQGPIESLATAAHLKLRTLDPLTGPPPGGWPRQANYLRLMEANLGALNSALDCPDTGLGS